jgi:hypothetical protein
LTIRIKTPSPKRLFYLKDLVWLIHSANITAQRFDFYFKSLVIMESYSSSSKLELGNSLLHSVSASNESSPQSSNNGDMKRKTCSGGSGNNNGNNGQQHLIPTSAVTGLTSDLSSLYALENLHHHHHHHHSAGLSHHHSHHSSHHHNLIGGGNSSITSIAPLTSSSQSIQSGGGGLLNSGNPLGLPG